MLTGTPLIQEDKTGSGGHGLPSPSRRFGGGGREDPGPDPQHKAAPVIGASDSRRAACGRVSGGRPAPAEDVPGSGPENSPSWGAGGGASRTRELGAGGTARPLGRWAPAKCAGNPPEQARAPGLAAHRWGLAVNL
ncbi:unnamed protein product [Rangifer tarandus platyrhynchus]|uniref:Uncharacterized protein n=1 Tax=Rangifer tarandus platyrhynchus TaxID=3082113 RepID=A0AC59ZC14_RANTA